MIDERGIMNLTVQICLAIMITALFTTLFYEAQLFSITGRATFTGRGCHDNQICDVITECTPGGACTNSYSNCQPCGISRKVCGDGIVTSQNLCTESGGVPSCVTTAPVCTTPASPDIAILTFNVFTRKNLIANVTPRVAGGTAGSTVNYKVMLENKNPKTLIFKTSAQLPDTWSINLPEEVSVAQDGKKEFVFRVTSNETASDDSYPILIGLYSSELALFGTVEATYIVGSRGPPSVNATPRVNTGYPGQTVAYNVTVTNTDPEGFDASTVSLRAAVPGGFNAVFKPASLKVGAQQSASANMEVTSPTNASEVSYSITINATANKESGLDFVEYKVDFCGNGVCDADEEATCPADCPVDPYIICDDRCQKELDDGLKFSATVSVSFSKFVVCSRESTTTACFNAARSNSCGIGKACLCTDGRSECSVRCVDTRGVFYLMVNGTEGTFRTAANYSYACPYVDLPGFKKMRDDFVTAKQDYEKAQSALREYVKKANTTVQERAANQPCIDALGTLIGRLGTFVTYLNRVIDWPGKLNTTAARAAADDMRVFIDQTYNDYCMGASGLLQIDSIQAELAEKGSEASLEVVVGNLGSIPYYGYVSCDIAGGAGEKSSVNGTCDIIDSAQALTTVIPVPVGSAGTWKVRCKAMGSLLSDCSSAAVHDDKSGNFTVFTKETFISDVSGSCGGTRVNCSVKSSRPGCTACDIDGVQCRRTGSVNNTDLFVCDVLVPGTYTLTGAVLNNANCKPVEPSVKNTTVRCIGCGDGVVDKGELCELPYTDNNPKCIQSESTCQGKLFGVRDKLGLCTLSCGCSYDEYDYACVRGKCGAECADGETRIVRVNGTVNGTCTQQCGSGCTWNACGVSDSPPGSVPPPTGAPTIQVSHVPQSPTQATPVTITATGTGATTAEIYVDGFIAKTCMTLPCSVTATYEPGVHNYFARAVNSLGVDTDPDTGTKSFTIPGIPGGGSGNGTGINGTGLNVTSVILSVSHLPTDGITPTTMVTLSAVANGPRSFREISIFTDGSQKKQCTNYPRSVPCTYRGVYTEGTHTYYAMATDVAGVSATDPPSGTNSFTVSVAGSGGTGGGPAGQTNATRGKCYAVIDSRSCTYNSVTRRYDVYISASWDNGTHAHWNIEDNEGPKVYSHKFNRTEQMSGPGLKNVKLLVHDVNDTALCYDSQTIYCGPGSASGKDVDIIIDVKNVVRLGLTDVRIIAVPYKDIGYVRLLSYTDDRVDVSNASVSGNSSAAGLSGPAPSREFNGSYVLYTVTGSMSAGQNVSLVYRMKIDKPDEYKLAVVANYSGKYEKYTKTVKATDCPQINSVLAEYRLSSGNITCKSFATSCDAEQAGWKVVEKCGQTLEEPAPAGDSPVIPAISVITIIGVLAAGYKYRDEIRERLQRLRSSRGGGKEETPSIEFEV